MRVTVKGNSNEKLEYKTNECLDSAEPVLREIRKMSRKLRHLLRYWKNREHSQEQQFHSPDHHLLHPDQEWKVKRIRNLRLEQTLNFQEVLKYYKQTQAHPLSNAIISRQNRERHKKEDFQITVKGLTVKGSELIALDIEMEDE